MAQIVPKLNLNKTPSLVENNSLIFAKNIRLDVDGSIHQDYGILPLTIDHEKKIYYSLIDRLKQDITTDEFPSTIHNVDIVGVIPYNNEFYLFLYSENPKRSFIVCYDEKTNKFSRCKCNWNWSGGTITGSVIYNLRSHKLLNIAESNTENLVPLKCIDLNISAYTDDESIYTQNPAIPLINLNFVGYFQYSIPNGVYQFFIRYRIKDNYYTNWFPASRELFIGNTNVRDTSFGTVGYTNIHTDSDKSFILNIEKIDNNPNLSSMYKDFQVGFIASHDDAIVGRAWKHFNFTEDSINFDYNSKDAYEVEITDFTKPVYQLYNVKNLVTFKNKLYVSNYIETNFNEDFQDKADNIKIEIKQSEAASKKYDGREVSTTFKAGQNFIQGIKLNPDDKEYTYFVGENGLVNSLLNKTTSQDTDDNVYNLILYVLLNSKDNFEIVEHTIASIDIKCDSQSLTEAQSEFKHKVATNLDYYTWNFSNDFSSITSVVVHGVSLDLQNKDAGQVQLDIIKEIYSNTHYLSENLEFVDDHLWGYNSIDIVITRPVSYDYIIDENTTIHHDDEYEQTIRITFKGYAKKYKDTSEDVLRRYTTLIPFQKYNFYVHYVKQTGETTNGYLCKGVAGTQIALEVPYRPESNVINYPEFTNIDLPDGYVACFFSIAKVQNTVETVIDIINTDGKDEWTENTTDSATTKIAESNIIAINAGLVPMSDKLTIKYGIPKEDEEGNIKLNVVSTDKAKYHYSGDSSNFKYFGANGVTTWPLENEQNTTTFYNGYIIYNYNVSDAENLQLVKCTPYINTNSYSDYINMNLLGYICKVYPLSRDRTIKLYTDKASVFEKDTNNPASDTLKELTNKQGGTKNDITLAKIDNSNSYNVYSNYNMNYLALAEDITEKFQTYYTKDEVNEENAKTIILKLLPSLIMSSVYELPSMYKNYTRPTYSKVSEDSIIEFNNTIRSSELEGDENFVYLYKFNANDYYNIPTNRGIITNLISVGDSMLVHTEDSMFKFSGSNNLQSTDGEIQTSESQPFDTGVSEVFGSDFGFAGLQNKTDCITTESGYIFFDRDSRIIYLYSGNGQMVKLSDSIEKLFKHRNIKDIIFANDYYNNRFFVSIIFTENNVDYPVTLSFSLLDNIKSFISLHDFRYNSAFNTKTKCYFITENNSVICNIDKNKIFKSIYFPLNISIDKMYPSIRDNKQYNYTQNGRFITFIQNNSIVDIICNSQYELIKTLNAINWCSYNIEEEFKDVSTLDVSTLCMAEDKVMVKQNGFDRTVPCKAIRIYSDTCCSDLIEFNKEYDEGSTNNFDIGDYTKPFFNQGYWTFNYFRNILNSNNNVTSYSGDENSLIEGKYFVIRFIFDKDFKLETLELNYNIKR